MLGLVPHIKDCSTRLTTAGHIFVEVVRVSRSKWVKLSVTPELNILLALKTVLYFTKIVAVYRYNNYKKSWQV